MPPQVIITKDMTAAAAIINLKAAGRYVPKGVGALFVIPGTGKGISNV